MRRAIIWGLFYFNIGCGYSQYEDSQKVTILWDTSLSMIDKNFRKESDFLQAYFKIKQNAKVTLLVFSNTIIERKTFIINSGDWSALKEKLGDMIYDGATSYNALGDHSNGGDILLFTDGGQNTNIGSPNFTGDLYIVNSKKSYNIANLNLLMILNGGEFINLAGGKYEIAPKPESNYTLYTGTVYRENIQTGEVSIRVKGAGGDAVKPNKDGSYQIKANPGDTLIFSVPCGKSVEKSLSENRNINVELKEWGGILLDEVVVTEKIREPLEETFTAFGTKDKNAVGYAVQSITEEDISDISTEVSQAIQGKFSGVSLGQQDDLSQAELRPKTSILSNNYGLVVVDGVPMPKSNSSVFNSQSASTAFIDPKNIASITVLKSLAATNRFGSLGANGAVLITTKTASFDNTKKKKDQALLTDNVYDGKIIVPNKTLVTAYLEELKKGINVREAYTIYLNQRDNFWDNPTYFIDVFDFFKGSAKALGYRILTNVLERESSSLIALRGMLFKMELEENSELALETADAILNRYPLRIQSYLDVALAHKNAENVQVALNMLSTIANGSINPELDFSGLKKTVDREIRNIVYHHKNTLDLADVDPKYLTNIKYDARVVIDWTTPDTQFELQFVNPQKRFFTWEHTLASNRDRIKDEQLNGYAKEEFEIVGAEGKGEWLINAKYLGNANSGDTTSAFLKCTVHYNFGTPEQRTEQHLLRLYENGSEELLAKLRVK